MSQIIAVGIHFLCFFLFRVWGHVFETGSLFVAVAVLELYVD